MFRLRLVRLIFLLCLILSSLQTADAKTVRVGTLGIHNLFTVDGHTGGYAYDYLSDIQTNVDWQYEFMPANFPDQLERLRRDEVDLVPLVIDSPENREEFLFSDAPMAHYLTLLCTIPDEDGDPKLKTSTPKIGLIDRYCNFHALQGYCDEHGIKPELVYFSNRHDLHRALQSHEIDATAINSFCYDPKETTIAVLSYDPAYFAINPRREDLVHELSSAQRKIHAISANYEDKLFQTYYEGSMTYNLSLTDEEQEFIDRHGRITVAVIDGFAPIMYWDSSGNPQGIAIETLRSIEKQFDIPVKFVKVTDIHKAYEFLIEGNVDLVASHFGMIDAHESISVMTTKAFFPAIQSRVMMKNFNPDEDDKIIFASDKLTRNIGDIPDDAIIFDTPEQAIEAVREGRAQIAIGALYVQENIVDRAKYHNLSCTPSKAIGRGISYLISRDSDPALRSIINKGIIARSESDNIKMFYRGAISVNSESLRDRLIYENPVETLVAILILSTLIFTSIYFQNRRKMLSIQLAEKEVFEDKLQHALEHAQQASQAKSDFLARMTHEIRTPITAIIGLNKMIEENPQNESSIKTWHRKIDLAGKHLLQLVNDILDISKLNANQIKLDLKEVSMKNMTEQIDIVYSEFAREKHIDLKFQHPDEEYIFIADEIRLKQILINLLSNAIKYNNCGGSVTALLEKLSTSPDKIRFRFSISDTGIGIAPDNLERIFHEFERTKSTNERWVEGAGLGLAISSKLARLMDSEIHVESKIGEGSRFWFEVEFPLVKIEPLAQDESDTTPPNCEGKHVLVAEDNEINAELITYILEEMNAQVDLAENGKIACEKFEASPEGFYSFVIMDIMMPVMGGYEATRKIRELQREDATKIPIIALSANSFEEDRAKSFEAGMSNHCAKPIDPSEFYSAIRKAIAA